MTEAVAVLARYAHNFSLAGRLLPTETLHCAAELYAFCRAVEDLVDETSESEAARRTYDAARCDRDVGFVSSVRDAPAVLAWQSWCQPARRSVLASIPRPVFAGP